MFMPVFVGVTEEFRMVNKQIDGAWNAQGTGKEVSAGVHFGEGRGATQGQGVGKPACGEGRGFYRASIDTGGGGGQAFRRAAAMPRRSPWGKGEWAGHSHTRASAHAYTLKFILQCGCNH